jgi:hypothetical protein
MNRGAVASGANCSILCNRDQPLMRPVARYLKDDGFHRRVGFAISDSGVPFSIIRTPSYWPVIMCQKSLVCNFVSLNRW